MNALTQLLGFPDKNRANLEQFLREVDNENNEHMALTRDFDEDAECRPTFEQLSHERVVDEAGKNILVLKSFETILQERMGAFNVFLTTLSKARSSFDIFQYAEGSLRQALDALFVFIEQELQQARMQQMLGDLRRKMSEVKVDAQKRLTDYQREVQDAEKEVVVAEKKLAKSKAQLEKCIEHKHKVEQLDAEPMKSPHMSRYGRDGRSERLRETEETMAKCEREIKEDIRNLLKVLSVRDQVMTASRRAYQKLDRECKRSIGSTLKKLIVREKEAAAARMAALVKLEASVDEIDVEGDVADFIAHHKGSGPEGALILSSQALSILGDLMVVEPSKEKENERERDRGDKTPAAADRQEKPEKVTVASLLDKASGLLGGNRPTSPPAILPMPRVPEIIAAPVVRTTPEKPKKSITSNEASEVTMHLARLFYTSDDPASRQSTVFNPIELQRLIEESTSMGATLASPEKDVGLAAFPGLQRILALDDTTPSAVLNHAQIYAVSGGADGIRGSPEESINWLARFVKTQPGRDMFVTVLNQFRSRKVNIGDGFTSLGAVLWEALDCCFASNDVHTAKVIMMLSQTFYRQIEEPVQTKSTSLFGDSPDVSGRVRGDDDDEEEDHGRDTGLRQYLKDKLIEHPIWHDGTFWEQVLWQCTIEQLQTIPYEKAWYDMDRDLRSEAVRRVHDVVFSQVMAITHSMIELGCSKAQTREFLYRMCVIHQLSEAQRHLLLGHLISR